MAGNQEADVLPAASLAESSFVAAWERLRSATEAPTAFSAAAFARVFAEHTPYRPAPIVVREDDGEFAAGLIGFERRVGPYPRLEVPPFVQFTPILLREPLREHAVHGHATPVHAILRLLRSRYASAGVHLLPEVRDVRAAVWSEFRVRPLYTYRIRLPESGAPEESWSTNAQRLLRKFGGEFHVEIGLEHVSEVVRLCAHSYERHGRALPIAAPALERLVSDLSRLGMIRVYALRPSGPGTCEAGIVALYEKNLAHYWIAGSRPGPGMTVLLGHVLRDLQASDVGTFDFVGANTPSVAEFKRRFGPELIPYYRIAHTRALGLRLLNLVRNRLT